MSYYRVMYMVLTNIGLPHHVPEVRKGVRDWALPGNVGVAALVPRQPVGIDVVRVQVLQHHARVVVRRDVAEPVEVGVLCMR